MFLEFAMIAFESIASKTEYEGYGSIYYMLLSGMLLNRPRLENKATNTLADAFKKSLDSVLLGAVKGIWFQP